MMNDDILHPEPDGSSSSFIAHHSSFVLVILGGELPSDRLTRALAARANRIVCADRGAEHARRLGLDVQTIVGDLDSVSETTLEYYSSRGTSIIKVAEQDTDDFQKSLEYVAATHSGPVAVLGLTGLRTDQLLSNLSVMLRMTGRFESLIAYDDFASYRFLTEPSVGPSVVAAAGRNCCSIECSVGTLVSLVPFGEARHVTTANLEYPLHGEDLSLGYREGLSNVATGSPVTIEIARGALLVMVGHAEVNR